jgi:Glycosyl hydrolases family 43
MSWKDCANAALAVTMVAFAISSATGQTADNAEDFAYLFTSFRGDGESGLHFLHSDDGYRWQEVPGSFLGPQVGSRLMRDPSIVRGRDGTFHLVWTTGWRGDRGFGYASSKDLVHWSQQRFIPAMEHEPETVNVWAPELFYDAPNERYIICWASTIPGRFPENGEPRDNNQRMYCTTTRDFKSFTPTKLFMDPGFNVIDCVIVPLEERYVLVLKDNSREVFNLRVARGDSPLGPWGQPSTPFTGKYTEGPSVLKLGDDWIVYYDCYRAGYYGAAKTRDFKTFVDISTEVSFPEGHKHGTAIAVSRQEAERLLEAAKAPSR